MALIQLVAVGQQDIHLQNKASQQYINLRPGLVLAGWDKPLEYTLERHGDTVTKLYFKSKVGAAPEGYRWKNCWPLHFLKKLTVSIGGQIIWSTNTDALRMKYLIDGLRSANHWASPTTPIEDLKTPPECLFDYSEAERTRLSREPHEVFFEPLSLDELIQNKYKLPLVKLAFHEVRVNIETGKMEDCLEPIEQPARAPPLVADDTLLQHCGFSGLYTFLDTEERRVLAQQNIETETKHYGHCSSAFEVPPTRNLEVDLIADTLASAAYIWITDTEGNEIPRQVVDEMKIMFNGNQRETLTGFQSRTAVRQTLPHPTLPNTRSQNLYYISYFDGRIEPNGLEQGANLRRLDDYSIKFQFTEGVPQNIKINVIHRGQNTLRFMHGMAGLRFVDGGYTIRLYVRQARAVRHPPNVIQEIEFTNTDQLIDILEDEKACMITYVPFKENDVVQKCNTCKKVFDSTSLDNWMKTRGSNRKCIHCQGPYNTTTFCKGKAHLLFEVEEQPVEPLIPQQEKENQGILGRIMRAVGLAERPHRD